MQDSSLEAVVVETGPDPDACIVWLHGLGADGHDFEPIAAELNLPGAVRFIFPHAPVRPVTINGGMAMRAWYDIASPDLRRRVDAAGIRQSQASIDRLLDSQIAAGVPPGRIVLGGFSQGGVIALETGVRRRPPLAGIVALSTYVALADEFPPAPPDAAPILMMHGSLDSIVPLALAEDSRRLLEALGYPVEWHVFPMAHAVCTEELAILRRWLLARFGWR
ncbi:phospholipase/carboxylesterase [Methylomarinovum tepidoasis]|uniref:Phospholipase/carboxylesterase n=1 Tax=Methylomarinovum tepidoasis TaxID=2840183 RepID=A0AAU9CCH9_9GAMM|nr:dienelactone hydrolase family protein [Methylomarinovum sp. IN45]BCX88471.1 phospholipase/carboxylesterase [Methylomarinovum sp. IN45]